MLGAAATEPLIERDDELGLIAERLDEGAGGVGGLLLLEGSAGIGKSSLLEAAEALARERGVLVLSARGVELEREVPFGIVRQLFEVHLARVSAARRKRLLKGPAQLVEPLLGREALPDPPAVLEPAGGMLRGLDWLCTNIAEHGPLLVSVDDAHWADERSLGWIAHLQPRLDELPVTIVLAVRTGEPSADAGIIDRVRAERGTRGLRPAPLSLEGSNELVGRYVDTEPGGEILEACHAATGGNPFLLGELALELQAGDREGIGLTPSRIADLGPEAVARSALLRLRRLPPEAETVARALAVLGEAPFRRLATLAALDEDRAARATDGLIQAELVAGDGELHFVHPVVRAAIYTQLPPLERGRTHRRAAQMLRDEDASPDLIASHLVASEPAGDPWAVEILREAARRAFSIGGPESGVVHLRRALAEPPPRSERSQVLLDLGRIEIRTLAPDAIEHLEEAVESAPTREVRRAALLELGRAQLVPGRIDEAVRAYEAAFEEGRDDREFVLRAEAELASAQLNLRAFDQAVERLDRHRERLAGETPGERMLLAVKAFAAAQRNEPAVQVRELATRAVGGSRLVEEQTSASLILWEAVIALLMADGYTEAEHTLQASAEDARRRGWAVAFAAASSFRAWLHLRRGSIPLAETEATAAADVGAAHGLHPTGPMASAFLIDALRERDELEAAERALDASGAPEAIPDAAIFQMLLYARGRLRIAQGRVREGLDDVLLAGRREVEIGGVTPAAMEWRSTAALAHARLGDAEAARDLAAEELDLARSLGAPRAISIALRAAGLVTAGEPGLDLLKEAVAVLASSDAAIERARALVALGAATRRAGRPRDARAPLREALEIAEECGATALSARAFDELRASGARPRRRALRGPDALTPSERRVAGMAAEGRSNRDIAADLFVTVRTVEFHLSHAYTKLEVTSREELPGALGEP